MVVVRKNWLIPPRAVASVCLIMQNNHVFLCFADILPLFEMPPANHQHLDSFVLDEMEL